MIREVKYRELLEHHFDPEVGCLNMRRPYWFMQDWARSHRTADFFTRLETTFGGCLIVLDGIKIMRHEIEWPPCSPDLNLCVFFL